MTRILLTGARSYITLDIARQLSYLGHKVQVAETSIYHVCRFSNAVEKTHLIPSPRFNTENFVNELAAIIRDEKIDLLIPTCEETFYISQNLNNLPTQVFCLGFDRLERLHNKWQFNELLGTLGFAKPKAYLIRTQADLQNIPFKEPYALKSCYCRASQAVYKVTPPNPPPHLTIPVHNPLIAQEWIEGERFCSYSVCHNGKVNASSLYPVEYAIDGTSCLTFRHVHHPAIIQWIEQIVEKLNYTGQIGFDFILRDNQIYAIECNPRATSGVHLFEPKDRLGDAFLNINKEVIYPNPRNRKQIAIGMMLYGWKKQRFEKFSFFNYICTLLRTKDVIFNSGDIKPFLAMPYLFSNYLKQSRKLKIPLTASFNYDIEWNNE